MIFATTYFFKTKKTFEANNIKDLINLVGDYDFINNIFYFKIKGQQIYKKEYLKTATLADALFDFYIYKNGKNAINHLKNCGFTIYEAKQI